jgi:hypothetical protein
MPSSASIRTAVSRVLQRDRPLFVLGLGSLAIALLCQALMLVDPRQLHGASVWLKPWKFGSSIAIAAFTLGFLLRVIDVPAVARRRSVLAISSLLWVELAIIMLQAARGRLSHFNMASVSDAVLFRVMGAAITIATLVVHT